MIHVDSIPKLDILGKCLALALAIVKSLESSLRVGDVGLIG